MDLDARLTDALASLTDGSFAIAGEPVPPAPPRRGLARLRPAAAPQHRYVQVARVDGHFMAEAVGATSFGGFHDFSPEVDRAIRDLGWLAPGDVGWECPVPNYTALRTADAASTAAFALATLVTMEVDPATVEVTVG